MSTLQNKTRQPELVLKKMIASNRIKLYDENTSRKKLKRKAGIHPKYLFNVFFKKTGEFQVFFKLLKKHISTLHIYLGEETFFLTSFFSDSDYYLALWQIVPAALAAASLSAVTVLAVATAVKWSLPRATTETLGMVMW